MNRAERKKIVASSLELVNSLERYSQEHVEFPFYQVEIHGPRIFMIGPDRDGKIIWFVDPLTEGEPAMANLEFPDIEDVWDDLPEDLQEYLMYNMDMLGR